MDVIKRTNELGIDGYTIEALAQSIARDKQTIHQYIKCGWLKAHQHNTVRQHDYYFFSHADVYELITNHPNVINHEKLSEERIHWTIDILVNERQHSQPA
jgi:hypothetical protein